MLTDTGTEVVEKIRKELIQQCFPILSVVKDDVILASIDFQDLLVFGDLKCKK